MTRPGRFRVAKESGYRACVAGVGVEGLRRAVASPLSFVALGLLGDQWQGSDPDAVRLDHDDAAVLECAHELRQVVLEQRRLVGRSVLAAVSEQDHRRRDLFASRQERSEVGVR